MTPGRRPIDAAIIYARRGWMVFPCYGRAPRLAGCACGVRDCSSPAKHPRVVGGLNAATRDEGQLRTWWGRWPKSNVGIRTGSESGIVVIDIDPNHGGEASLAELCKDHGPFQEGRTVRTGSGGWHLYFRHPGVPIRNRAGTALGPGIDVRGEGGYVIAPPSRHRSGAAYVVTQRGGELPELPEWMLERLVAAEPRRSSVPADASKASSAWGQAAMVGELDRLGGAVEGTRNDTLNRVAFRLGQLVGSGCLDEPDVERALVDRGLAIGLGEREVLRTVRSGLTAGEAAPRGPAQPHAVEVD